MIELLKTNIHLSQEFTLLKFLLTLILHFKKIMTLILLYMLIILAIFHLQAINKHRCLKEGESVGLNKN